MSRQKTLPEAKLKELSAYALSLGLNANNLSITITDQVNCPSEETYLRSE